MSRAAIDPADPIHHRAGCTYRLGQWVIRHGNDGPEVGRIIGHGGAIGTWPAWLVAVEGETHPRRWQDATITRALESYEEVQRTLGALAVLDALVTKGALTESAAASMGNHIVWGRVTL